MSKRVKFIQMETDMKAKREILYVMVEVNIFIMMAVTTLVIGLKGRCKEKDNLSMQMVTSFTRDNGETITIRERVNY